MVLLAPSFYESLFVPLIGRRVGFYLLNGNVGDDMSKQATRELFKHFGVDFRDIEPWQVDSNGPPDDIEHVVVSGGGNMGSAFYLRPYKERLLLTRFTVPITVFPQSFLGNEEDTSIYQTVFVRERESLKLDKRFRLAPDMALGLLDPVDKPEAESDCGMFLRTDVEARFEEAPLSLGDPARLSASYPEYLELAARFDHVITDRLHFAIAALVMGRRVTLLPNSYFKNRAVFDEWLRDFDCSWIDDPGSISYDVSAVRRKHQTRLAGPPSQCVDWDARIHRKPGFVIVSKNGNMALQRINGEHIAWCDPTANLIWSLCDGKSTVRTMLDELTEAFPEDDLEVAGDLQRVLNKLNCSGAVHVEELESPGSQCPAFTEGHPTPARVVFEINVNEAVCVKGKIRLSADIRNPGQEPRSIWYEADESIAHDFSRQADPFLLASLMHAMYSGRSIAIHGAPVSPGLLRNIEQYQQAWSSWRSELSAVDISAEQSSLPGRSIEDNAILSFSGGVDSSFSAYRYLIAPDASRQHRVTAAVMVHGFDMSNIDRLEKDFRAALERSRRILSETGIDVLPVRTNAKILAMPWLDGHGLMLGSVLSLFSTRFAAGIIPSTAPYALFTQLGSNAVTDWMMGSDQFRIVHHGAYATRIEKIKAIAPWQAAVENLRVCFSGPRHDRNCGRCMKCVLTHLGFWSIGLRPACFDVPLSDTLVLHAIESRQMSRLDWLDIHSILIESNKRSISAPWVDSLRYALAART